MDINFIIIIPTYNRPKMLAKAIRSLDYQSYRNYEIIVVHDGVDCKEDFKDTPENSHELHYYSSKKLGSGGARNIGLELALVDRMTYILYLDDDDELANDNVLEDLATFIKDENYPMMVRMGYIKHFVNSGVKKLKVINPKEKEFDNLVNSPRVSASCTAVASPFCVNWLENIRHQDVVHHIQQCDRVNVEPLFRCSIWDKPFFIYNIYDKPEAALDSPENKFTAEVIPNYLRNLAKYSLVNNSSKNAALKWADWIEKRYK